MTTPVTPRTDAPAVRKRKAKREVRQTAKPVNLIGRMDRESPAATEARRIVSHLLRREPDTLRTVLITSAEAYEGKSTVAGFLAAAGAQYLKKRTLLMDADLRHPSVHVLTGLEQSPGLSDWLAGTIKKPLLDFIRRTPLEHLHVLCAGSRMPHSGQLLETGAVESLLGELGRLYDLVIIDSPPVMPVTDPLIFAPLVDASVLTIKVGVTQRQAVRRAFQLLRQAGGHVAGCVLNDIVQSLPSYYSASYYAQPQP